MGILSLKLLGVWHHGAKFIHVEAPAAFARALLGEQNRCWANDHEPHSPQAAAGDALRGRPARAALARDRHSARGAGEPAPRRGPGGRLLVDPAAQYILLSSSSDGDPLNANVPGMYQSRDIAHPPAVRWRRAQLTLSGQAWTAATPWAQLPQALLDRTCFFHHGTYTVVHPDLANVMSLQGFVSHHEMLVSLLSEQLGRMSRNGADAAAGPRPAQRLGGNDGGRAATADPLAVGARLAALVAGGAARADPEDPRCRPRPAEPVVQGQRQLGPARVPRPVRALAAAGAQRLRERCSAPWRRSRTTAPIRRSPRR